MRHSCFVSALRFICFARELAADAGDSALNDGVETEVRIFALRVQNIKHTSCSGPFSTISKQENYRILRVRAYTLDAT
jgi:hypothetical protein